MHGYVENKCCKTTHHATTCCPYFACIGGHITPGTVLKEAQSGTSLGLLITNTLQVLAYSLCVKHSQVLFVSKGRPSWGVHVYTLFVFTVLRIELLESKQTCSRTHCWQVAINTFLARSALHSIYIQRTDVCFCHSYIIYTHNQTPLYKDTIKRIA
jgi:hypothetical protein